MRPSALPARGKRAHDRIEQKEQTMARELEGVVLLDVSPGAGQQFEQELFEKIGHPALVCHGPHDGECPLLTGEGCEKFEAAHGIVFELDLDRPQHQAILTRYRALAREDLPIHVVVSPEQAQRYAEFLADVQVWTHLPTAADLDGFAAEVEAADR
jgi:hypothetical protein